MVRGPLVVIAMLLICPSLFAQKGTGEERILSYVVRSTGIDFRVASGGCTHKAHFGLEKVQTQPLTVRLVRLTPDYCEALLPEGVVVQFTFAEIGAGPKLTPDARQHLMVVNADTGH